MTQRAGIHPSARRPSAFDPPIGCARPAMTDTLSLRPIVGRRRLWELDPHFHCSIVGTCLTMSDLRKLATKTRLSVPADAPDYRLHGVFVRAAGAAGPAEKGIAKLMDKDLERRHTRALAQFRKAADNDALEALWDGAREAGDIPGPYWALMCHPLASRTLLERAFGEVHMLSHLMGAANRADVRRLAEMERETEAVEDRLAEAEARRLREIEIKQGEIGQLRAAIEAERARTRALVRRLEEAGEGGCRDLRIQTLEATMEGLRERLNREAWRADRLQGKLAEAERLLTEVRADRDDLRRRLAEQAEDLRTLEDLALDDDGEAGDRPPLDLGGRTILYVGGRPRTVPSLRKLVEDSNGRFAHHDAGREDGRAHLGEVLSGADIVICPVDCISHDACLKAKRACLKRGTPFVPLSSAGLGAFARCLRETAPLFAPANDGAALAAE
ncbi:hypothetical protein Rru_A1054 [Rhodospirillum rubrum ATCC 11170]|uniref:DUF2325 domain-containing protein n=2 Tax=Rhodospirillum rubrum TaxID=1085 RepID=Q2RVJ0_RHORT|nr:hypothetical protein Rru_A1054 [Rhodospirillum rubrum ATCC 11170]MBK5953418.1 hypothetical protein [Rhodospirillum rubrum]HAQ01303.1 DUF2325 domain-containing protein [Rhodospirillum rubrum]HCF18518.1 DUF2325 domain-containing protein [Rhodospirillum rubrum]